MGVLNEHKEWVRQKLREATGFLSEEGLPQPALDGKVLRPLSAFLLVPEAQRQLLDRRFWSGALAVEMVHEASLLHDDILDEAPQRRGKPTMASAVGVGPALVLGDHLLTAAYRAAAVVGSSDFLQVFIRSVERTVAGEIAQEGSQGRILSEAEYFKNITRKSGELFRSAFSLPSSLLGLGSSEVVGELGARFGRLYQMVDDFLDYCPKADRGKAPLQDYRQKKWTWPLGLIGVSHFEALEPQVLDRLFESSAGTAPSPMEEGVTRMKKEFDLLVRDLGGEGFETSELHELLQDWIGLLHQATGIEVEARRKPLQSRQRRDVESSVPSLTGDGGTSAIRWDLAAAAGRLDTSQNRLAYFGHHAKTFRFAARLFPEEELEKVAGVYAFCRFTDDLVDEMAHRDAELAEARLNAWLGLSRAAYEKGETGVALLDDVMGEMNGSRVPFHYVEELVEGMRMDLTTARYRTLDDLRVYSYRVASVVGGWLTELFGIRDPWVLDRAFALGHAMQLTNILRDVGEDLRMGRVYLPDDLMGQHGVDRELLEAKAKAGGTAFPGYRRLLEALMAEAEADYEKAFEAIPALPSFFQGPVAVAANVYRGIHREIRRNHYDNLTLRANTSLLRKIRLGAGGIFALRRSSMRKARAEGGARGALPSFPPEENQEAVS